MPAGRDPAGIHQSRFECPRCPARKGAPHPRSAIRDAIAPDATALRLPSPTAAPAWTQHMFGRLFHPFVTTKGEAGTGLGLWVSKGSSTSTMPVSPCAADPASAPSSGYSFPWSAQVRPNGAGADSAVLLFLRQFLLDRRDQFWGVRQRIRRKALHHFALAAHQKLLKIPKHLRVGIGLNSISLQLLAKWNLRNADRLRLRCRQQLRTADACHPRPR